MVLRYGRHIDRIVHHARIREAKNVAVRLRLAKMCNCQVVARIDKLSAGVRVVVYNIDFICLKFYVRGPTQICYQYLSNYNLILGSNAQRL